MKNFITYMSRKKIAYLLAFFLLFTMVFAYGNQGSPQPEESSNALEGSLKSVVKNGGFYFIGKAAPSRILGQSYSVSWASPDSVASIYLVPIYSGNDPLFLKNQKSVGDATFLSNVRGNTLNAYLDESIELGTYSFGVRSNGRSILSPPFVLVTAEATINESENGSSALNGSDSKPGNEGVVNADVSNPLSVASNGLTTAEANLASDTSDSSVYIPGQVIGLNDIALPGSLWATKVELSRSELLNDGFEDILLAKYKLESVGEDFVVTTFTIVNDLAGQFGDDLYSTEEINTVRVRYSSEGGGYEMVEISFDESGLIEFSDVGLYVASGEESWLEIYADLASLDSLESNEVRLGLHNSNVDFTTFHATGLTSYFQPTFIKVID